MFDFTDILKNKLWAILITAGAICLFSASMKHSPTIFWQFDVRETVRIIPLLSGILLITIGLYILQKSEQLFIKVNIKGRWEYEVHTAEGQFSHKGDCLITQKGSDITVRGTRLFTCSHKNETTGETECKNVNIPWFTTWASICLDNYIRFDYTIDIPNDKIEAICKINIPEKNPTEVSGKYYLLPPFGENVLNCQYGQIKLKKIEKNAKILPPN